MGVIFLDYYIIGQKIRKFRKALGLSQEALAEKIGISVTHMSHIETGNTKLSLSVFLDIADALNVQADDLLHERAVIGEKKAAGELADILNSCTQEELYLITEVVRSMMGAVHKYIKA